MRRRERSDTRQIVTTGEQRRFDATIALLRQANVGEQAIAQTSASDRVGFGAAFGDVLLDRFGGAAIDHASVRFAHGLAQIAEVADAFACVVTGVFVGNRRATRVVMSRVEHAQPLERIARR